MAPEGPYTEQRAGAVTLLATDIVGSSALWEREFEAMGAALRAHDALVASLIQEHGGYVFKTTGDGFLACFGDAVDAARCALALQTAVAGHAWPTSEPLRIRTALHTGTTVREGDDHFGPTVNRLARLVGEAEPATTVLSAATHGLVAGSLPEGVGIRPLGARRLRGIEEPVQVYALAAPGSGAAVPARSAQPMIRVAGVWPATGRPFVGRQREIETLLGRLGQGGSLVTVTGPGGIGKTSLLCQVAQEAASRYPDGCLYVDCQPFGSESEVALAIVQAFGGGPGAEGAEEAAIGQLQGRRLLLALDCYEALAAAATLPARIIDAAPGVDVLLGSRAVMGLARETELPLGPLPLASDGQAEGTAEDLLLVLATGADATFAPSREGQAEMRRICRLLDGIPLLLGIAAARLRHVGVTELREQLEEQGAARMTADRRGMSDRHASIRRVVADSVRLLEPEEAGVLQDMAVFEGGALYRDIEALLAGRHPGLERCVHRLRDHSLLLTEDARGRKRYRMLDTIREAVHESGPLDPGLVAAHARHYATHAGRLAALTAKGELAEARYLLLAETGNFRASVAFAVAQHDPGLLESLFRALGRSLQDNGLWDDYERLAAAAREGAGPSLEAEILGLDGALAARRGNRPAAARAWRQRAQVCRDAGDFVGQADALLDLAESALRQGDLAATARYAAEGLLSSRRGKSPGHVATAWAVGAELSMERGRPAASLRRARRAQAAADGSELAVYVHLACGKVLDAAGLGREALSCHLRGAALAYRHSTLLPLLRMLAEAASSFRKVGDGDGEAVALATWVALDRDLGAGRAGEARKALAALRRKSPAAAEEAERLVRGSGWEAGVEALADRA